VNFEFLFLLSGHAVSFIYGSRFKVSVFFRTEPCTCCPLLKEWLVVSTTNIRIHGAASSSLVEERMVDTPNLRFAEFSAPCQPNCIALLRDRLLSSLDEFGVTTDLAKTQTCMAVDESLANAFYHGSLELDSSLKEDGSNTFSQLAKERCQQSPWKDRRVSITELATPFGLWITIRDEGRGFDVATALKRAEDPMSILASGRGLVMMEAFTDELIFNSNGNEVTLVIYHNRNQDVVELMKERSQSRSLNDGQHSQI
jgi:hypothetical protein